MSVDANKFKKMHSHRFQAGVVADLDNIQLPCQKVGDSSRTVCLPSLEYNGSKCGAQNINNIIPISKFKKTGTLVSSFMLKSCFHQISHSSHISM